MKEAPGWWIDWRGHFTLENRAIPRSIRIGDRDRGKQRLGVGMERVLVQALTVGDFCNSAQIHDGDAVRDVLDHSEVVCDEKQRQIQLRLQLLQQVEDLGLNGDIECRNRFVSDHEIGFKDESSCNPDPLALPSGEFVWEAARVLCLEAHKFKRLGDSLASLVLVPDAMELETL